MRPETIRRLDALFRRHPLLLGGAAPVAEIEAAEKHLARVFDADYREFLERFGGAMVGSLPVFGLRVAEVMGEGELLLEMNRHYRAQRWPHADEWTIFSTDGRGNPIGLAVDGAAWTWDHDSHELYLIAPTFEAFLTEQLGPAGPEDGADEEAELAGDRKT